jgi:glucans biosynthesis protein
MSASSPFRLALVATFALMGACGDDPGTESTLPLARDEANPTSTPVVEPGVRATPADLAAFVEEEARSRAARPWQGSGGALPAELDELDYDAYRSIRFRPEAALWRDVGDFEIQLFHPGFIFDAPVRIHLVGDSVRTLGFDPRLFRYEGDAAALADRLDEGSATGYAGFRVHFPINAPDRKDEFAVFQGASYFRLVGRDQVYGLSARGLAVDIATDGPEEFPAFTDFWLVRPAPDADTLVVHALLDGPSVTGAYRLALVPGERTMALVDARLFARADVGKLGVAPLSSMFLFDADLAGSFDDFRGAVHDSDGLLMRTRDEEWIWRPLGNLRGLRVTSLRDVDPRGFGLVQRARDFDAYLDLEARYHQRPSAWVQVAGEERWGDGGVELLEIPSETEFADNVAAYWVPSEPFRAGDERRFRYTLSTFGGRLPQQTLAQVVRTRSGAVALPGAEEAGDGRSRRFAVDFDGGALPALAPETAVQVRIGTLAGDVDDVRAEPLPGGGWRASFVVRADGTRPADMRLWLEVDGEPVTETWSYAWYPDADR